MMERILALFGRPGGAVAESGGAHSHSDLQLAAAALLVEAALMDERFEDSERNKIRELLQSRFRLGEDDAESLISEAQERVSQSSQLFGFTRVVKDRFSQEERIDLVEMLWEVAYVDGKLDDYEANLMRRIVGLIHVPDRDSGAARKRVLARLANEN